MILARVVGNVVSTHKDKGVEDIKLLLVEKIVATSQKGSGDFIVAMDSVGAGDGEIVLVVAGSSARMTELTQGRPCDAAIMAAVDTVNAEGKTVYDKSES